jgi:hypothetical protein
MNNNDNPHGPEAERNASWARQQAQEGSRHTTPQCKRKVSRQDMAGACHEAAHAVVARRLGLVLRTASYSVSKLGARTGFVEVSPGGIFEACFLVAGYVAELRAFGWKDSLYLSLRASSDFERLYRLLAPYLGKDQLSVYKLKLEDDVGGFLYQPGIWGRVCQFAEALLKFRYLGSEDCTRLTDPVPRARLADIQHTMLCPVLHNHIGRRIGRAKHQELEKLLREAVEKLRVAFSVFPPLADICRALIEEGYAPDEAESLMLDVYSFWLNK